MKNIFKVAAIAALVGFGSSAMADDATATFQWVGTIAASSTGGDTTIVNLGPLAHDAGTIVFQESGTPGEYEIKDASKMYFGIEETDTGVTAGWTYELTSISYSIAGSLPSQVNVTKPEFEVVGDGTALAMNAATPIDLTSRVELTLGTPQPLDSVKTGDEVVVQAAILVTHP